MTAKLWIPGLKQKNTLGESHRMTRDQVFISYSYADGEWLRRLQIMLAPLQRQGTLDVWEDTRIQAGQVWKEEIQQALGGAGAGSTGARRGL